MAALSIVLSNNPSLSLRFHRNGASSWSSTEQSTEEGSGEKSITAEEQGGVHIVDLVPSRHEGKQAQENKGSWWFGDQPCKTASCKCLLNHQVSAVKD